jgi:uncharacterized OB-fold protein
MTSGSVPAGGSPSALPADWAVPALDVTNRAWFTSGELALQQCGSCATVQHPPEEICHVCGSMGFTTRTVSPTGRVHSYTVVHHAAHPALAASVPYVVVLVSLDDMPAVRVVGNLLGVATRDVTIDMPVEATWESRPTDDGEVIWLPQWRPRG